MSLAKIPISLLVSYAFKKGTSPPNPPPPKEERITTNFLEHEWYTTKIPKLAGNANFLLGILEAATILAWNYPSTILSQFILSGLIFNCGRPERLHLSTMNALGGILIVVGALLRLITYRYLGKFFKFEASIQKDHKLITSGPYTFVRHPSYTGLIFTHPGWIFWHFGDGSWVRESGIWNTATGKFIVIGYIVGVLCGVLYLTLARMGDEDEALKKRFGKDWDNWVRKVPYLLVPRVY
ncbi:hypothetical protein CPB84DRAFT_1851486 [Gymnopilus junonius]|uniref:Protein-S-isoprenylcysteine O-methyltransferase n=1 Tax=Gymnopilus junonius TaxID=109634 RepID=A0A9P5NCA7_GYMJU|nr:hypothetical protein CPB84DRAFT_1851486 [Gymnopilus junonius]